MTNPAEGDQNEAPYDPFRYGRPEPGSAAAAAYPDLFPPAPEGTTSGPGWYPSGAPSAYPPPNHPPPGYPAAGYPPPGYPSQDPWSPAAYAKSPYGEPVPRTNGQATAGFVLGILSVFLFWLTLADLVLVVLGIVFSVKGRNAAKRGAPSAGLALWGLILSIVAAVVIVAALSVAVSRTSGCEQKYTQGSDKYNKCIVFMD